MGYAAFFWIDFCMWVLLLYSSTGKGKSCMVSLSEGDDECDGPYCLLVFPHSSVVAVSCSQITVACMSDAIHSGCGVDAQLVNSGMGS